MQGFVIVLLILCLIGFGFAILIRKIRSAEVARSRRWWIAGTVSLGLVVAGVIALVVVGSVRDLRAISRPIPAFDSLTSAPDPSLKGRVAYVAERKDITAKKFNACAVVSEASGAEATDLTCWPFDTMVPVTVRWADSTTVEVTGWGRGSKGEPKALWSKQATLDGNVTDLPSTRAVAPKAPGGRAPSGMALHANDHDGNVQIDLVTPSGPRTLLDVRDAQIWWHLLGSAGWSPDGAWIANVDSSERLLITTTLGAPSTRVLATGVIGMPSEIGMPAFAVAPVR